MNKIRLSFLPTVKSRKMEPNELFEKQTVRLFKKEREILIWCYVKFMHYILVPQGAQKK